MGTTSKLKAAAEKALPAPAFLATLNFIRKVAPSERRRFELEIGKRLGGSDTILDGPFAGMHYLANSYGSAYLPKLVGCYEAEIADAVTAACAVDPDVIVDIGCAEGYYAVGMALKVPSAKVYAFDTSKVAQCVTERMTRLNDCTRQVQIGGFCDHEILESALKAAKRPVVICDCENYEEVLIDPAAVPSLSKTLLIVEVHGAHISKKLMAVLAPTHTLEKVAQGTRPFPSGLEGKVSHEDWVRVCDEGRIADQDWLVGIPKIAAS